MTDGTKPDAAGTTVGVLYPGHSAEDDYARAAETIRPAVHFEVVHTSVGRDTHEIEALLDTGAEWRLRDGAEQLRDASPAAVMWACTSGSFVYGLAGAQTQVERIAKVCSVPASSTSLAFISALRHLGIDRVAISATYPADVTERFRIFLEDAGVAVSHVGALGIMDASEGGRLSPADVQSMASSNDHAEAEAILLPDTALHTIEHLAELQTATAKPLLTANQVTVWEGLRLAGHAAAAGGPIGVTGRSSR